MQWAYKHVDDCKKRAEAINIALEDLRARVFEESTKGVGELNGLFKDLVRLRLEAQNLQAETKGKLTDVQVQLAEWRARVMDQVTRTRG